jgi:hypothetical protein
MLPRLQNDENTYLCVTTSLTRNPTKSQERLGDIKVTVQFGRLGGWDKCDVQL